MNCSIGNNDQNKQKDGSPFPINVFPEEVFPPRIFPWMGNDTDHGDNQNDDESPDQEDEHTD